MNIKKSTLTIKNIRHNFDLTGAVPGDWFIGCIDCGHQFPYKTAVPDGIDCPGCFLNSLYMYTVTPEDVKLDIEAIKREGAKEGLKTAFYEKKAVAKNNLELMHPGGAMNPHHMELLEQSIRHLQDILQEYEKCQSQAES